MLRWRLLLGALLIAALVALCWLDLRAPLPGLWLFPAALLFTVLAASEFLWLARSRGLDPSPPAVYLGCVAIVASNLGAVAAPAAPLEQLAWPLAALALSALAACTFEVLRYRAPGRSFERLALAVFGQVYVGLLLSVIVQLRLLDSSANPHGGWGIAALASLLIVVKMCDTGAYTVGRLAGRRKMCPLLSPGKTWEGTAGGLAFACLGAWLSLDWLAPRLVPSLAGGTAWWLWLPFGLLVGAAGVAGDLVESLLKRDVGRKDSSSWLPGFGGVLDLLDSLLFAAPVVWLCWKLALVRP